ncbi:MAG: CvpA family protein [Rhodanobacteraceae bacterium]
MAVLLLSVLMGLVRGFVGEALALACWVVAFWLAWTFGPTLADQFSASISVPSVRLLIGYVICFVAVLIAGAIVGFLLRKLIAGSGLSGSDRLLGMVFGLVRGLALVTLVVFIVGFTPFQRDPWWHQSLLLPRFKGGAQWLGARLPADVARYLEPDTWIRPEPKQSPATPPAPHASPATSSSN